MGSLSVLIADDHPLFRRGIRALVESDPHLEVTGEAENGPQAVEMASATQPDVVLMDLQMPDGNGLDATRELSRIAPQIRILVVTLFDDDESVFAALRAGARGYVLKDADDGEMLRAIRVVGAGGAIFSPAIATRMIDHFAATQQEVPASIFPELTDRERQVLQLIARGKSNSDIADELVIAVKTVQNHVSNIYDKLQVADRAQAAIRARDAGLK